MEIKKVLEHTCSGQRGNPFTPQKGCNCRRWVSEEQARLKVAVGASHYVHIGTETSHVEKPCTHCTEDTRRSCLVCSKTGKVIIQVKKPIQGEDIISTVTESGNNNRTVKVKKSPTIESKHILRGIENSQFAKAARERWDEYQLITLKERIRLLTKQRVPVIIFDLAWEVWLKNSEQPFPFELREEPEDNPIGKGRRYDYGRPV